MDNDKVDLLVLRRVEGLSPGALSEIAKAEGDQPYFPDWVDNDLPRDAIVTDELMEQGKTLGFAVASRDGTIRKKFRTVVEAEQARKSARISFDVNIDVGEANGEENREPAGAASGA